MRFQSFTKSGNVGDDVTFSGRPFHVRAAATLNVLLSIVDSLNGGTTVRPGDRCWQSGDDADPANQTHGRADPSNLVQSNAELYTSARQSGTGCAPERATSVNWQARQLCGWSDVAERSTVL